MKKNIVIFILLLLILILSFAFFIREGINLARINKLEQEILNNQQKYETKLAVLSASCAKLFSAFKSLIDFKQEEQAKIDINSEWQEYEITAYSTESGTITYIGIDLEANYSKYLNVCAVDPSIIPLGSTVLVRLNSGEIKAYLACDTGGLIKGSRIDLYFDDIDKAINFGRQKLMVKIIK